MTDTVDPQIPTPAQRRRPFVIAVVRGMSVTIVLTVAYFSLPLKALATLPFVAIVLGGESIGRRAHRIGTRPIRLTRSIGTIDSDVHPAREA